jgi:hypothetical protein
MAAKKSKPRSKAKKKIDASKVRVRDLDASKSRILGGGFGGGGFSGGGFQGKATTQ